MKSESDRPHSLKRHEMLKSRKAIEQLFVSGKSVKVFPVLLVWQAIPEENSQLQVAFSVSKKRFKRAVDRNRIKRLMREAVRLNKELLVSKAQEARTSLQIMFIYTGKELESFQVFEKKIIESINRLSIDH